MFSHNNTQQGLGNAFLSNIAACDALFHLTRAFEDDDIIHVEGEVNPVRDLDIIHNELRLKVGNDSSRIAGTSSTALLSLSDYYLLLKPTVVFPHTF
jgi:ribosome-binding ATPase YchF (GTP1/OBG family)